MSLIILKCAGKSPAKKREKPWELPLELFLGVLVAVYLQEFELNSAQHCLYDPFCERLIWCPETRFSSQEMFWISHVTLMRILSQRVTNDLNFPFMLHGKPQAPRGEVLLRVWSDLMYTSLMSSYSFFQLRNQVGSSEVVPHKTTSHCGKLL